MKVYYEDLPDGTDELDYCRQLMKEGMDPDTPLEFWRKSKDHPDLFIKKISSGARLKVRETDRSPEFVRFTPMTEKDKLRLSVRKAKALARSDHTAI